MRIRPCRTFLNVLMSLAFILPLAATAGEGGAPVQVGAAADVRGVEVRRGSWQTLTRPVSYLKIDGTAVAVEPVQLRGSSVVNWRWAAPDEPGEYDLEYEAKGGEVYTYTLFVTD